MPWNRNNRLVELGKRIRMLRLERGLVQEDFDDGTELGIAARNVRQIEHGRKDVRISTLFKIAERLGVPVSDLLDE